MIQNKLEKISKWGMALLAGLFLLFLFGNRLGHSYRFPRDYYEIAAATDLSVKGQLLFLVLFGILLIALFFFYEKIKNKSRFNGIVLFAGTVILLILSLTWVFDGTYFRPGGDPLYITDSARAILRGEYDSLMKGGYLERYPYQKGLVFFEEIIFSLFGDNGYGVLYFLNALSVPAIYVTGYGIQKRCSGYFGQLVYLILLPLCFPLIFYTCFIYGECLSILFSLLTILSAMLWRENKIFIPVGGISAFLALVFRTNSTIVLIAIGILSALDSLKKREWRYILFAVYLFVCAFVGKMCIELQYEIRTGIEAREGMPLEGWLLMGFQEGVRGNGWYNDSSVEIYEGSGCDSKAASGEFQIRLGERVSEMVEHPRYAYDFFRKKILSQWNEATLESLLVINSSADGNTYTEPKKKLLFYEWYIPFIRFMENYQLVIYAGALCFALFMGSKRVESTFLVFAPLLTFIGGFLFQMFWEAKSRYILFYFVFLILVGATGLEDVVNRVKKILMERSRKDVAESRENI